MRGLAARIVAAIRQRACAPNTFDPKSPAQLLYPGVPPDTRRTTYALRGGLT